VLTALRAAVSRTLVEPVPRDHLEPDGAFRRRRWVAALTLLVGAGLLGVSLSTRPGDARFIPLTASVALVWVIGGVLSGPLHLGYIAWHARLRRPLITPLLLGLLMAAVFVAGALVIRTINPLRALTADVLEHAQRGDLALVFVVTLASGASEELFFRGALYAAIGRRYPVIISSLVYTAVTIATRNPMLVFAAAVMGTLFGLQRRASGGILASMITHVTWSALMLVALPPLLTR
jgi:hypothetical protein